MSWSHCPLHLPGEHGAYILTGSTYRKDLIYKGNDRLAMLQDSLLAELANVNCNVQAWAVFPNHYHVVFVAQSDPHLPSLTRNLHSSLSRQVNAEDNCLGRKVWFQYWETHLTFQRSYLARLKYVHHNAVHHGLVKVASDYAFCSANWFESTAEPSFLRTVESFQIDKLKVPDDF